LSGIEPQVHSLPAQILFTTSAVRYHPIIRSPTETELLAASLNNLQMQKNTAALTV